MSRSGSVHGVAFARPAANLTEGKTGVVAALELLEEQAPSRELGEYLAELRQRYGDVREKDDVPAFIRAYLLPTS